MINGISGSGKTVFAFLLFIIEKNVLFIFTNKKSCEYFEKNKIVKQIEKENNNKIIYIWNFCKINDIEDDSITYLNLYNWLNYDKVIFDEFNNIKNKTLISIKHHYTTINSENNYRVFFGWRLFTKHLLSL